MSWDTIQQYVRILAYGASGFLAGRGWISDAEGDLIGGMIVAACTLGWTIYWNTQRKDA